MTEQSTSGINSLPDKDGGQVIDDSNLPPMTLKKHDSDPVREALNRAEYFDHRAVGEVDGYAVRVIARVTNQELSKGFIQKVTDKELLKGFIPEMMISVGGEWDHELRTYLGGSTIRRQFDSVFEMDEVFGKLCREYGLLIIPPDRPETSEQSNTGPGQEDER